MVGFLNKLSTIKSLLLLLFSSDRDEITGNITTYVRHELL